MNKLVLASLLLSTSAFANLHLSPPDFNTPDGRAIFVDFKTAEYSISYDIDEESTVVKSKIVFESSTPGHPLFDLVPAAYNIKLDGQKVKAKVISFPGKVSKLRFLTGLVPAGIHTLEMENTIAENVSYYNGDVSSAFWIRDLTDRKFLEQYIPSNFEYDQYQTTINVKINGRKQVDQDFYANGVVTRISPNSWKIVYPDYFTVSSLYFHMTPKNWMSREDFNYESISGRQIPMTIYSPSKSRTKKFVAESIKLMKELENDYGAWGHPSFIAYGTGNGKGGMEHSGATAASFGSLDHEMLHSYFAKGVMPADGNSGWIDEAIASWRDHGYQRNPIVGFGGSNLGSQSVYKRNTDRRAYALGRAFMAYLDYRLQNIGGLKAYLKGYYQTYNHQVINNIHFKNNLEFFLGETLDEQFATYIFGENTPDTEPLFEENPVHRPMSRAELKALL